MGRQSVWSRLGYMLLDKLVLGLVLMLVGAILGLWADRQFARWQTRYELAVMEHEILSHQLRDLQAHIFAYLDLTQEFQQRGYADSPPAEPTEAQQKLQGARDRIEQTLCVTAYWMKPAGDEAGTDCAADDALAPHFHCVSDALGLADGAQADNCPDEVDAARAELVQSLRTRLQEISSDTRQYVDLHTEATP